MERQVEGVGRLRAMLVCDVLDGVSYETLKGRPFMLDERVRSICDQGHDSIRGLPGSDLNYDELVVYDEAQALPLFLVVYRLCDGDQRWSDEPIKTADGRGGGGGG